MILTPGDLTPRGSRWTLIHEWLKDHPRADGAFDDLAGAMEHQGEIRLPSDVRDSIYVHLLADLFDLPDRDFQR